MNLNEQQDNLNEQSDVLERGSSSILSEKQQMMRGHRARLKEKFMRAPIRSISDYEVLEMLLFKIFNRKDTKHLSKKLLSSFHSLAAVLAADASELRKIEGVGSAVIEFFKLLQDLNARLFLPVNTKKFHVLNSWTSVINYCQLTIGFQSKEYFRALFLNKRNILIADELFNSGTVDRVAIYPREITKHAINYSASAVIMVHNHPSGDVNPSQSDIEITNEIQSALSIMNIVLHDHIIVSREKHFSFRSNNLVK